MSLTEPQYYEAKVFLKALVEAHRTLEDAAKQQAQLDKLKYYESSLVSAAKKGQVRVSGDNLLKGTGFESTRVAEASQFVKRYFGTVLRNFDSAKNASELTLAFEGALK